MFKLSVFTSVLMFILIATPVTAQTFQQPEFRPGTTFEFEGTREFVGEFKRDFSVELTYRGETGREEVPYDFDTYLLSDGLAFINKKTGSVKDRIKPINFPFSLGDTWSYTFYADVHIYNRCLGAGEWKMQASISPEITRREYAGKILDIVEVHHEGTWSSSMCGSGRESVTYGYAPELGFIVEFDTKFWGPGGLHYMYQAKLTSFSIPQSTSMR